MNGICSAPVGGGFAWATGATLLWLDMLTGGSLAATGSGENGICAGCPDVETDGGCKEGLTAVRFWPLLNVCASCDTAKTPAHVA